MAISSTDPDSAPDKKAIAYPAAGARHDQTFPTLTAREIDRLRRFGTVRSYGDGEALFQTGQPSQGMFILLSGHVSITQHDGLGHVTPVVEEGPGQFLAEVGTLAGRPALVDGHAEGAVEAIVIPPENVRGLMVAEAELGERIMRALILRRVALIDSEAGGPVLIGPTQSAGVVRLEGFLLRNGHPHHHLDPAVDSEAREIIARYAPGSDDLPLVACPDGSILRNPSEAALARVLGMVGTRPPDAVYDVAVVGAGPAGLATAVYAASEGLSVAVLDSRAYGGQAGASARIENYLGFPTGISGLALAGRAYVQAQKFGAEMMIPVEVKALDCARQDGLFALGLADGPPVRSRTVVVASGARYRRPEIADLDIFEGRGVWYWASPIEARLSAGKEVILVGGGNSAGQAAVFLCEQAARVRMLVRGPGLAASMSRYLIDRIAQASNIELVVETEVVGLEGSRDTGLEHVRYRDRRSGEERVSDVANLFLFAGADPATEWLAGCGVAVDAHGFVVTGASAEPAGQPVPLLQSTVPGVFAVGDVRSGSVKRVGGAIGEGANVVPYLHDFIAGNPLPATSERENVRELQPS